MSKALKLIYDQLLRALSWKWLFLLGYYYFIDFGQEIWPVGTEERIDFYFVNLAAFMLLLNIFVIIDASVITINGKKIINDLTKYIFVASAVFLTWDLMDHLINSGKRIFKAEAMQISAVVFLVVLIHGVWSVFSLSKSNKLRDHEREKSW